MLEHDAVRLQAVGLAMAAMVIWLTIVLAGVYLLIPRRSGRLFEQQRSLDKQFTLTWDEAALTQIWDGGSIRTPWREYHSWFETPDVMAFGLNDQLYHFAPKRALTPELAADLRISAAAIAAQNSVP